MKRQTKLNSEQQQEQAAEQHAQQQTPAREFSSAEELLRFEAANTVVPASVAKRLQRSTENLPSPKPSWWRRFFGGSK